MNKDLSVATEEVFIPLELADGSSVNCRVEMIFEVEEGICNGGAYIALIPENMDEVLMFRYSENEEAEEIILGEIETEEELELVIKYFEVLFYLKMQGNENVIDDVGE